MRSAAQAASPPQTRFVAYVAESRTDVHDAQRLRRDVFRDSLGVTFDAGDVDVDRFDAHCDHLLVRDTATGTLIGTYRILSAAGARRAGGFYSETEFDLSAILASVTGLAEVGRACVHPAYRRGGVIALLLGALARHLVAREFQFVIGCASVPAGDDPAPAGRICRALTDSRLAPPRWRATPHRPFRAPPGDAAASGDLLMPPLIKAYLRLGAYVCGEPAWDADFGTADLLLMLPMAEMDARYRGRLLREVD